MHIPIKVDYGVRALVDLARNTGDSPVRATEIAARAAISVARTGLSPVYLARSTSARTP